MTRGEEGRDNVVALDVSVRRSQPQGGVPAAGAAILFFTGVRYQRPAGDAQVSPPVHPAGADELRAEA